MGTLEGKRETGGLLFISFSGTRVISHVVHALRDMHHMASVAKILMKQNVTWYTRRLFSRISNDPCKIKVQGAVKRDRYQTTFHNGATLYHRAA